MAGRTLIYNVEDEPTVHAIQDQYKLTPLSCWGTTNTLPENCDVWVPYPASDPLATWKTINRAMTENPPLAPDQQSFLATIAQIGVGPNQDVEAMDAATKRGPLRAEADSRVLMYNFNITGGNGKFVNGWSYPPQYSGGSGLANDFLTRVAHCNVGLVTLDAAEGTYINVTMDSHGLPLNGANAYVMRFAADGLPEVGAFWSVTMYDVYYSPETGQVNKVHVSLPYLRRREKWQRACEETTMVPSKPESPSKP